MYKKIIEEIFNSGGQAYITGGYVRDMLLEIESKDIDIEVFGISENQLETVLDKFGKWKKAGKEFEVYIFKNRYEFSFPRNKDGEIDPDLELKEASKRRDFTMNSLYYDVRNNKILDFNNGISDIRKGIIRETEVHNSVLDPIRMLRAIQFMARYNFEIEKETLKKIKNNFHLLKSQSKERIFIEIEKILLKSLKPSKAFIFLKENKLLNYIFPELEILSDIYQDEIYHPEGDVFTHTMMCLDVLELSERDFPIMLALLWHDVGKAYCRKIIDGKIIIFEKHAELSAKKVSEYFRILSNNKQLLKKIKNLILYHEFPLKLMLQGKINNIEIKKLAVKTDIPKLLKVYKADVLGRLREDNSEELAAIDKIADIYNEIKNQLEPIINGKDLLNLGVLPDSEMGKLLDKIFSAQLEEEFYDRDTGLEYSKRIIGGNKC